MSKTVAHFKYQCAFRGLSDRDTSYSLKCCRFLVKAGRYGTRAISVPGSLFAGEDAEGARTAFDYQQWLEKDIPW